MQFSFENTSETFKEELLTEKMALSKMKEELKVRENDWGKKKHDLEEKEHDVEKNKHDIKEKERIDPKRFLALGIAETNPCLNKKMTRIHLEKSSFSHPLVFPLKLDTVPIFVGAQPKNPGMIQVEKVYSNTHVRGFLQVSLNTLWEHFESTWSILRLSDPCSFPLNMCFLRSTLVRGFLLAQSALHMSKKQETALLITDQQNGENLAPAITMCLLHGVANLPMKKCISLVEQASLSRGRKVGDENRGPFRILFRAPWAHWFLQALQYFPLDISSNNSFEQIQKEPLDPSLFSVFPLMPRSAFHFVLPMVQQILVPKHAVLGIHMELKKSSVFCSTHPCCDYCVLLYALHIAFHKPLYTWNSSTLNEIASTGRQLFSMVHTSEIAETLTKDLAALMGFRMKLCETSGMQGIELGANVGRYVNVYFWIQTTQGRCILLVRQRSIWYWLDIGNPTSITGFSNPWSSSRSVFVRTFDSTEDLVHYFSQEADQFASVFQCIPTSFLPSLAELRELFPYSRVSPPLVKKTPPLQLTSPLLIDSEHGVWFAEPLQEVQEQKSPKSVVYTFPLDINSMDYLYTRIALPKESLIAVRGRFVSKDQASSNHFATRKTGFVLDVNPLDQSSLWINQRGRVFLVGGHGDFLFAYCCRQKKRKPMANCEVVEGQAGLFVRTCVDLFPGDVIVV